MKDVKIKAPKNQTSWTVYKKDHKITHVVTSTLMRDKYFLYEVESNGSLKKLASSHIPIFKGFNDKRNKGGE